MNLLYFFFNINYVNNNDQFNDAVCQLFSKYHKLSGGTHHWVNLLNLLRAFVGVCRLSQVNLQIICKFNYLQAYLKKSTSQHTPTKARSKFNEFSQRRVPPLIMW